MNCIVYLERKMTCHQNLGPTNHSIPSYCHLPVSCISMLNDVAPLGAVNHKFNFSLTYWSDLIRMCNLLWSFLITEIEIWPNGFFLYWNNNQYVTFSQAPTPWSRDVRLSALKSCYGINTLIRAPEVNAFFGQCMGSVTIQQREEFG